MQWFLMPFKKYFEFKGRSQRKEYWTFTLVNMALMFILALYASNIAILYQFIVFIPSFTVAVRRLHDANASGWWLIVPHIFMGILLVSFVLYSLGFFDWQPIFMGANLDILSWLFGFSKIALLVMIAPFIILFFKSDPNTNKYGPNPQQNEII